MKIIEINENALIFDNGSSITYEHERDCCEVNYADFKQIDDIAKTTDFEEELVFEALEHGFKFGNLPNKMFFVPCYSSQNGYYSTSVDIYYNNKKALTTDGEFNDLYY